MSSQQFRAKLKSALQNFASGDLRTSVNDLRATLGPEIRTIHRLVGDAELPITGLPTMSPVMRHPIFQER